MKSCQMKIKRKKGEQFHQECPNEGESARIQAIKWVCIASSGTISASGAKIKKTFGHIMSEMSVTQLNVS